MRRILHLLALLALILVGSVPEVRLEAAPEPPPCCCGEGGGCGMPSRAPSPSPCSTQVPVTLVAVPPTSTPEQASPAEVRKESLPWPASVAKFRPSSMEAGAPIRGPSALTPSPPDRQAQLSTFRI
ncbi:MAG: hypothetical protein H6Q00_2474 [Holophagaceae bacterium]|nr:hypothetical protein [Holophagaceae bacterium]